MINDNDKVTPRDMFNYYFTSRDLEIKTHWTRVVFLVPIIILIMTGYGKLWSLCITEDNDFPLFYPFAFLVISFLGIIFSELYILMSRASKRAYERLEFAIESVFKQDELKELFISKELRDCDNSVNVDITGKLVEDNSRKKKDVNESYPKFGGFRDDENKLNRKAKYLSVKAGTYSVSRVGICICIFLFLTFIVAYYFHLMHLICVLNKYFSWVKYIYKFLIITALVFLQIVSVPIMSYFSKPDYDKKDYCHKPFEKPKKQPFRKCLLYFVKFVIFPLAFSFILNTMNIA